jgi:hypothetical protein
MHALSASSRALFVRGSHAPLLRRLVVRNLDRLTETALSFANLCRKFHRWSDGGHDAPIDWFPMTAGLASIHRGVDKLGWKCCFLESID